MRSQLARRSYLTQQVSRRRIALMRRKQTDKTQTTQKQDVMVRSPSSSK